MTDPSPGNYASQLEDGMLNIAVSYIRTLNSRGIPMEEAKRKVAGYLRHMAEVLETQQSKGNNNDSGT